MHVYVFYARAQTNTHTHTHTHTCTHVSKLRVILTPSFDTGQVFGPHGLWLWWLPVSPFRPLTDGSLFVEPDPLSMSEHVSHKAA